MSVLRFFGRWVFRGVIIALGIWGYASIPRGWWGLCLDEMMITLDTVGISDLAVLDGDVEISPHHNL
jgi:hypothetical protein